MILNRLRASPRLPPEGSARFFMRWLSAWALAVLIGGLSTSIRAQDENDEPSKQDDEEYFVDYTDLWTHGEYRRALEVLLEQSEEFVKGNGRLPLTWALDRSALNFEVGNVDAAIAEMESIARQYQYTHHWVRLALLYQYRGRKKDYEQALERALEIASRSWSYGSQYEKDIAFARILELKGENPKTILNVVLDDVLSDGVNFPPGLIAAGDLAYRKYDYALAADYFNQALKLEGDNVEALAGLAECYWKSNDERLEPALARVFEINPHHPRPKAIQVESLLDAGKTDAALEIIESVLAINPNHLRFQSLKSAVLFLDGDLDAMTEVQDKVLEFNPHFSEVFRTTGRIASRHYRFEEGAQFQQRALETDGEDHHARTLYAFDVLRLGREKEGRAELDRAFDNDPYNVQAYNMLKVLDSLQRFAVIERGAFRLQVPRHEKAILAEDALALLEEAFDLYEEKYRIELEKPVLIQIFDNHDDFMVRSVGLPGSIGYMGICFGRLVTMDSPSARSKWTMNWRSVLWHEFVHVITLQKTKNRMPRWLSEGISVYEETQRSEAWGQRMDIQYKSIIDAEPLPGLSDLEKYFTQSKSPIHLMLGYFLAGEFVNFYVEEYGFAALRKSLELIAEGEKAEPALAEAAGHELDEIDKDFELYTKARLAAFNNLPAVAKVESRTTVISDEGGEVTLAGQDWASAGSPFTDAMREATVALDEERWDDAERELKKAHEAFPDYMAADAPLRRLIELYERLGKTEELKAALRQEIEWNQTDFPACRKLVELLRKEEDWAGAAEMADWALGIDPFDAPMRQSYLDSLLRSGDNTTALTVLSQLVVVDKPRATDYRLKRVEILIGEEEWPRARMEAVALLEDVPHFWEAQQMLLRIVEAREAGPKVPGEPAPR